MKKLLVPTLVLAFSISAFASSSSFIMKVKSVDWDVESMAIDIKGTNGEYIAYLDGTSKSSLSALEKAAKKKSCVKITPKENSAIEVVSVQCPTKLSKVKQ